MKLPPAEQYGLVARLNGLYHGILAGESFTLSQGYYYGRDASNAAQDHRVELIEGHPIDLLHDLDQIAIGRPNGSARNDDPFAVDARRAHGFDEDALIAAIASGEKYHESCTRLIGKWAQQGVALLEAQERMLWCFDRVPQSDRNK